MVTMFTEDNILQWPNCRAEPRRVTVPLSLFCLKLTHQGAAPDRARSLMVCWWLCLQKITSYDELTAELSLLRVTVPLSLFCLDCVQLNEDLMSRSRKIRQRLVDFEVNENREINKKYVVNSRRISRIVCISVCMCLCLCVYACVCLWLCMSVSVCLCVL